MDRIRNTFRQNKVVKQMTTNMMNMMKEKRHYIDILFLMVIGITFVLILLYIINEIRKKQSNISRMKENLDVVDKRIQNINYNDAQYQYKLRDYNIMSSYNSCCDGNFENGYVSLDALKQVIFRGARVLDFEIYSLDNKTVIAASDNNNFYQKGTYNSLPFEKTMDLIERYAFSASTAPNYNDPLFLHFRIKSKKPHVFNDMAKSLASSFSRYRLPSKYNYESGGENIGSEPLKNFNRHVIFVCDKENNMFENSPLDELINFASGTVFLQKLRNYDVLYAPNGSNLIEENKKNMAITMPDLMKQNQNVDAGVHFKYGCQLVCMNFQNVDSNLVYYLEEFNNVGSAFLLKPAELRYEPKYAKNPEKQNPQLSYAPRTIKKPYFQHKL